MMLFESLAMLTGLELASFVGKQILGLGGEALKDYVKDFFKDSIKTGVVSLERRRALEDGMSEAIATLTQLFEKELQVRRVDPAIAKAHYREPFRQFLKDKGVRGILGSAFGLGCEAIASDTLAEIWQQHHPQGVTLKPEKIDWDRIGFDYLAAVQGEGGIIETHPELRELLSIQLQKQEVEALTELAGPKVGFDLTRYREALLEQYGALKLESLGTAKYETGTVNYRTVPLWNVFVAQTAREFETVSPQLMEIPKEQLRRMQAEGLIDGDAEAIWQAQKERYFDSSPRSVLEICRDPQLPYQVVLGDPGAGKSTLVRYLAVEWARSSPNQTASIPLLIELRRYIQSKSDGECKNFLEFIHQGSNWVGNLNQGELDRILAQGQVLVMFDGLDEVVERQQRGAVLKAIHGFSQTYPQARIMVTSRVIGYRPEDLRGAGFRHFMLQDLDRGQMQQFIDDWHQITYGDAAERERKQGRLERAIDRSKAIFELAGNPLLLTLMAILNRGEELPRDRVRLYKKAAEVLLFQWDFEEKEGLVDPRLAKYLVELDFRDKRAMLQQVAYRMQSSEKGLAGNFVTREVLQDCLVDYLKHKKDAAQAPSIAGLIIEQLRERNFILCALGGDNYAFIHRTFLEYFCASEIVERFGRRGTEGGLTFEQLRDEVFGAHWQDETWHEVLRLICGEIADISSQLAGQLIEFLMNQEVEPAISELGGLAFEKENFVHLVLAADCLEEVRDSSEILAVSQRLLQYLQEEVIKNKGYNSWDFNGADDVLQRVAVIWGKDAMVKQWLLDCLTRKDNKAVSFAAVKAIVKYWKDDPDTLDLLKECFQQNDNRYVRHRYVRLAAVQAVAKYWKDDPDTLALLKDRVQRDDNRDVRRAAMRAILYHWKDDSETLPWIKARIQQDDNANVRNEAVMAIAEGWKDGPDTLPLLKERVQKDDSWNVRHTAVVEIAEIWKDDPDTLPLLKERVQKDDSWRVRHMLVQAISRTWKDDPDTLPMLKDHVQNDDNGFVRWVAVEAIAEHWKNDPDTPSWLKDRVQHDHNEDVRRAAVQVIAEHWKDDPETLPLIKDRVQRDDNGQVRSAAVSAISDHWKDDPDVIQLLLQVAIQDPFEREEDWQDNPRQIALQALLRQAPTDPRVIELLRDRAENDGDKQLRNWAQQQLNTDVGDPKHRPEQADITPQQEPQLD